FVVSTTPDFTPTFTSVGPAHTAPLASGGSSLSAIPNGQAVFQYAPPTTVGVSDVTASDWDDAGAGYDGIAFIHERINSITYKVRTVDGSYPPTTTFTQNWRIYRAYTSLADAENGTENTGILSGLTCNNPSNCADHRNFDTFSGGKNIVASGEQ